MDILPWLDAFRAHRDLKRFVPEVIADPQRMQELIGVIHRQEKYPYAAYASWLLDHVCKKRPDLVLPHSEVLIEVLLTSTDESLLRNCAAVLHEIPYQTEREGALLDRLLEMLAEPQHKVALHVRAIYLLIPIVKRYPELKAEVQALVQHLSIHGASPALQVAIRNFNKKT